MILLVWSEHTTSIVCLSVCCGSSWGFFLFFSPCYKGFLWGSFSFLKLRVSGQRVLFTVHIWFVILGYINKIDLTDLPMLCLNPQLVSFLPTILYYISVCPFFLIFFISELITFSKWIFNCLWGWALTFVFDSSNNNPVFWSGGNFVRLSYILLYFYYVLYYVIINCLVNPTHQWARTAVWSFVSQYH